MIVDASVWVSVLVGHDVNHTISRAWLHARLAAHDVLAVPTLFLPEVAVAIARRRGISELGRQAVGQILLTPGLRLVSLDTELSAEAARLAADLQLKGADAVYVATARTLSLPLVTWDQELHSKASRLVKVLHP